jgi:FkbM family methyltransferase
MLKEYSTSGAEFTVPTMSSGPPPMKTKKVKARHGTFTIHCDDELVGLSLDLYGEYSEGEVVVFKKCIRPGMTVIDVGANIGAFTVPMAKLVGETGHVWAFEASSANVPLLIENLAQNGCLYTLAGDMRLNNTTVLSSAASDKNGKLSVSKQDALHAYTRPDINTGTFEVDCITIDSLNLSKCDFIKIDVDRHEIQVLNGAAETIRRFKPIIYIENEDQELSEALIAKLVEFGYRMYWHRPFHWNPKNFNEKKENVYGQLVSIMMLCVPEPAWDGKSWDLKGLDEVADIRDDDDMFEREIKRYSEIVERNPDDLMSRLLVAHYNNLMLRHEEAYRLINENLKRDPTHKASNNIKGLLALQRGRWKQGFEAYELRYEHANINAFGGNRVHKAKKWDGKPTHDPVLIWSEQGFGDQIMFARFFKEVKRRAPNAFLEVSPELFELFDHDLSRQRLRLPAKGNLYRLRRSLPEYLHQCSIASLPHVLDIERDEQIETRPYLFADEGLKANWQGTGNHPFKFGIHPMNEARIGLCAKGSFLSERPYTRDIKQELLGPFVKKHGPFFSLEHSGQFDSFATSAAAIDALDLVITVDTSIAHLAGALGKPVWLLLSTDPDWRWGLHSETTVWYQSMRIFRQPKFRDWQSVLDRVSDELSKVF